MHNNRGKVVLRGILGHYADKVITQVMMDIFAISILIIGWYVLRINLEYHPMFIIIIGIAGLLLATFLVLLIVFITGFETDTIYEQGVTNRDTLLIDKLLGRTYQPFESIAMVKYGKTKWFNLGDVDFIALIDRNKGQIVRTFLARNYKNNFYQELIHQIKKKCPNAEWIPSKYKDIKKK